MIDILKLLMIDIVRFIGYEEEQGENSKSSSPVPRNAKGDTMALRTPGTMQMCFVEVRYTYIDREMKTDRDRVFECVLTSVQQFK